MISIPTFLTLLYCLVDDFCKTLPPEAPRPGEAPSLSRSEVVALSIFLDSGHGSRVSGASIDLPNSSFVRYSPGSRTGASSIGWNAAMEGSRSSSAIILLTL